MLKLMKLKVVIIRTALAVGLLIFGVLLLARLSGIYINMTPSVPRGIYLRIGKRMSVGDLVIACPSKKVSEVGLKRGYLSAGSCPFKSKPLLKRVIALGGDLVRTTSSGVYVNEKLVSKFLLSKKDDEVGGVTLRDGELRLSGDEVFLFSDHVANSWDSRYFGPVKVGDVLGVVMPMWVVD